MPAPSRECAHLSEPVSLIVASAVSGTEAILEKAPFAPASIARAATLWSRYAVKTSAGMRLASPEAIPGHFNICSGTPRSVLDMATALQVASGTDAAPEITGGFRLGDVRHVFADATYAAEVLGFAATEDFDGGMRELFADETASAR